MGCKGSWTVREESVEVWSLDAVVRRVFVATIGAEADRSKHRALVLRRVEEQSSATPYVQLWSMSTQFQLTSKANIEGSLLRPSRRAPVYIAA